jgi:hypothetical protein
MTRLKHAIEPRYQVADDPADSIFDIHATLR